MASPLSLALAVSSRSPMPWNKALSGILGSISLTSWLCLLVPQLIENYQAKSAEALSMGFVLAWFFGDVASLAG